MFRCKQCPEPIEIGDAMRTEPIPGQPGKVWRFHPGCHLDWRASKLNREVAEHLERWLWPQEWSIERR